VKVNYR